MALTCTAPRFHASRCRPSDGSYESRGLTTDGSRPSRRAAYTARVAVAARQCATAAAAAAADLPSRWGYCSAIAPHCWNAVAVPRSNCGGHHGYREDCLASAAGYESQRRCSCDSHPRMALPLPPGCHGHGLEGVASRPSLAEQKDCGAAEIPAVSAVHAVVRVPLARGGARRSSGSGTKRSVLNRKGRRSESELLHKGNK